MLNTLYVNQPVLQQQLWALLKENDDCPFDSYEHLDDVIRIALHQNWLVREKNQTDRKWYLSVHKTRVAELSAALAEKRHAEAKADDETAAREAAARREEQD